MHGYRFLVPFALTLAINLPIAGCKGGSQSTNNLGHPDASTPSAQHSEANVGGAGGDRASHGNMGANGQAGRGDTGGGGNGNPGSAGMVGGGSGGSTAAGRHFNAPAVAPIVREATPSALKPTAALRTLRAIKNVLAMLSPVSSARALPVTDVNASIRALFNDMYNKISGGHTQGLINSSLEDLDSRMSFVDMAASTSTCLSAQPQLHRIDLRSIAPAIDFTLHLQCNAGTLMAFGRDDSGMAALSDVDGGMGSDSDAGVIVTQGPMYSLWLYLNSMTEVGGFGYYANVYNVGTGNEAVDFLFLENHPSLSRIQAYRVKAQPSTRRFEFVYGATDGGGSSGDNLRCGFRMISDGNYVWAEGKDRQPGQACADALPFTRCLHASDLSQQAMNAPCRALGQAFTMDAPTADALVNAGPAILAALPVETSASETKPF